jgi:hypothetical protein
MQQRTENYQIVRNEQYKTSVLGPLLHYIRKIEGRDRLQEVHVRICGGHIGADALAAKVVQQGFYWLAMIDDAAKLVSTCEA